jgi:carbonic anhydrase/acetyltransferase-like protein (isoleucine patch superfamily)
MAVRPHLGVFPVLGARVFIDPSAVVIGRVTLGDDASVWPLAVVRGDVNRIDLGKRTNIQDGCILHVAGDGPGKPGGLPLLVGDDVTVGHRAVLHAARIGARCLIGMAAVVLDGAVIEDEVILGAGGVVPPGKRLESRGLYLGNPAKRIREVAAAEVEQLLWSAHHYVRIKDQYRAELSRSDSTRANPDGVPDP